MKWEVTGADKETGIGRSVVVKAADEESSIRKGNQLGILVEKSRLIASTDANEAAKKQPPAAVAIPMHGRVSTLFSATLRAMGAVGLTEQQSADGMPDYVYILKGNGLLKFFAMVLRAIGVVLLIGAALCLAFAVSRLPSSSIAHHEEFSQAMSGFAAVLAAALPCFIFAVLLQIVGTVALAVRDTARKSFKNRGADS